VRAPARSATERRMEQGEISLRRFVGDHGLFPRLVICLGEASSLAAPPASRCQRRSRRSRSIALLRAVVVRSSARLSGCPSWAKPEWRPESLLNRVLREVEKVAEDADQGGDRRRTRAGQGDRRSSGDCLHSSRPSRITRQGCRASRKPSPEDLARSEMRGPGSDRPTRSRREVLALEQVGKTKRCHWSPRRGRRSLLRYAVADPNGCCGVWGGVEALPGQQDAILLHPASGLHRCDLCICRGSRSRAGPHHRES